MSYSNHCPYFCDPNFHLSSPKSWHLPLYANGVAKQLAQGSYKIFRTKDSLKNLQFVDDEAIESEGESSSAGENSSSSVSFPSFN